MADVSMGEEQEKPAKREIENGFLTGKWLVLNNCHLSVDFMAELEEILNPKDKEVNPDFRLFITCEPNNEFPLGLLQMAIKVSIQPPKGLQASLSRTFSTMINQDFLEKVEPYHQWRSIVFAICFMHTIVYERRKFGPLGFCIPYHFNASDLDASLLYAEKHMTLADKLSIPMQWNAIRYMTCDVQYGGRITDNLDRELFRAYGDLWLTEDIFKTPNYQFNTLITDFGYIIPDYTEHSKFVEYINTIPEKDPPLIFGLNSNADLTFRLKDAQEMINTLLDTQPKESSGGSGKSREEEVKDNLNQNLIKQLPADFIMLEVTEKLRTLKGPKGLSESGMTVPLNVFLFQEIQRFQKILGIVRTMMHDIVLAIDGQIIMTPELVDSINAIFDFRVPRSWQYDPTGAEISWLTAGLAAWLTGLNNRYYQLRGWIDKSERPASFWLTGFFNPQGFLTSMKQEVTRQKKAENWSLDEVDYKSEVTKDVITSEDGKIDGKTLPSFPDGVLIHGLFLEGAQWAKGDRGKCLIDSEGKDLFQIFPVLHVSAMSTAATDARGPAARNKDQNQSLDKTHYFCPVYKYKIRNDKYLIFRVYLAAEPKNAAGAEKALSKGMTPILNWKLKGVALLCSKE